MENAILQTLTHSGRSVADVFSIILHSTDIAFESNLENPLMYMHILLKCNYPGPFVKVTVLTFLDLAVAEYGVQERPPQKSKVQVTCFSTVPKSSRTDFVPVCMSASSMTFQKLAIGTAFSTSLLSRQKINAR